MTENSKSEKNLVLRYSYSAGVTVGLGDVGLGDIVLSPWVISWMTIRHPDTARPRVTARLKMYIMYLLSLYRMLSKVVQVYVYAG